METPTCQTPESTASLNHELGLSIVRCAEHFNSCMDAVCMESRITRHQYNLLRVLRDALPHAPTTSALAEKMIERAPDMTRRLELLERRGFATRSRNMVDRRLVCCTISAAGSDLLTDIEPRVDRMMRVYFDRMTSDEQKTMCDMLAMLTSIDVEKVLARAELPVNTPLLARSTIYHRQSSRYSHALIDAGA